MGVVDSVESQATRDMIYFFMTCEWAYPIWKTATATLREPCGRLAPKLGRGESQAGLTSKMSLFERSGVSLNLGVAIGRALR